MIQTFVLPLIAPGVGGAVLIVTAMVCAVLLPQVLLAVTVTFPLVVPVVVFSEFVAELPVQPAGVVHV